MGQVIIKIPQEINQTVQIEDVAVAERILRLLEKPPRQTIQPILPAELEDIDADEAFGIWADREESAEEIARKIRENNRRVT